MKHPKFFLLAKLCISVFLLAIIANCDRTQTGEARDMTADDTLKTATFAGGCFWCMQPSFDQLEGIVQTSVGYTGGDVADPTYEQVLTGQTGHAEAIEIRYDPAKVSYAEVLEIYWRNIDPTTKDYQFADKGTQYRTAIFYHDDEQKKIAQESKDKLGKSGRFDKPIVTEIVPAEPFYAAEEHHQKYYQKNPLRYQMYKVGSGREGYLKSTWPEKSDKVK